MKAKFQQRFIDNGQEEFNVLSAYTNKHKRVTSGTIQCKICGEIQEDIDLNSKLRYKSRCKCQIKIACDYCDNEFSPNSTYAKTRKVCYNCNPYIASHDSSNEYKNRMRELNWNKYLKDNKIEEKCSICGYNKYRGALEWHHINPKEKDKTPASIMHHQYSKVKKELDKCILVCSNCHREIHHNNLLEGE